MTNELKEKSEKFITLINNSENAFEVDRENLWWVNCIPIRDHIQALQKVIDDYEKERERLTDRIRDIDISKELGIGLSAMSGHGTYGHGFHDGIREALAIMTEGTDE